MRIINSATIPIYVWSETIEKSALRQAENIANFPYSDHHIVLLPDVHPGFGVPIGCVFISETTVVPNAVGKDIGCGMLSVKTDLSNISQKILQRIVSDIRKNIPMGFHHNPKPCAVEILPPTKYLQPDSVVLSEYDSIRKQIGTLGGGNHFIEFQKDREENIWIMIHSGSRNIGKKVADHYHRKAVEYVKYKGEELPGGNDLAYLQAGSVEYKKYFSEMNYCTQLALVNRKQILNRIMISVKKYFNNLKVTKEINIAHNFAEKLLYKNKEYIVHRKGATRALKGTEGIIPGSQGTRSYIVKGAGNEKSFYSCSHGAGRVMGRKKAQKYLDLRTEKDELDKKKILHSIKTKKDLDEAPSAYKNIKNVIDQQKDLAVPVTELSPIAVIKG